MAQLAIKGHPTRGKEIIEILEMLGGKNSTKLVGNASSCGYYIDSDGNIAYHYYSSSYFNDAIQFTIEKFLEKFPYKVGDKVQHKGATSCGSIYEVEKMRWEADTVKYTLRLFGCNYKTSTLPAEYLQPYKEETMEKEKKYYDEWLLTDYLEFEDNDDVWADEVEVNLGKDYEIQIRGDKTFIVKKKSQYPKTYEECCKVLLLKPEHATYSVSGLEYERHLIVNLQRLLICRNAYWKIAGEQMELGKPWKPDFTDTKEMYYIFYKGYIEKGNQRHPDNHVLIFPTVEMRDAFYENFKELIELCKELL